MSDATLAFAQYAVQGVEGQTGNATVSLSAPGFTDGIAIMTVEAPFAQIVNLNLAPTSLSVNDDFQVRVGIDFDFFGNLLGQAARVGGGGLTATLTNTNPAVAQLVTSGSTSQSETVTIAEGFVESPPTVVTGGVALDLLLSGNTDVSATIPGHTGDTKTVTITAPTITMFDVTLGAGLQAQSQLILGATGHGGVDVLISSSDPTLALVSPDANTPGTPSITVNVPDGTNAPFFHVQGVEGQTGTATVMAVAPGFTDGTGAATIEQPQMQIRNLNATATASDPNDDFQVRVGIDFDFFGNLIGLAARAGGGGVTVDLTNSVAGVGQLVTTGSTSQAESVQIAEGQSDSPTTVLLGGVAFDALGVGATLVEATSTGFVTTSQAVTAN